MYDTWTFSVGRGHRTITTKLDTTQGLRAPACRRNSWTRRARGRRSFRLGSNPRLSTLHKVAAGAHPPVRRSMVTADRIPATGGPTQKAPAYPRGRGCLGGVAQRYRSRASRSPSPRLRGRVTGHSDHSSAPSRSRAAGATWSWCYILFSFTGIMCSTAIVAPRQQSVSGHPSCDGCDDQPSSRVAAARDMGDGPLRIRCRRGVCRSGRLVLHS